MIPTAIIYEHEHRMVSIYTGRSTFEGTLEVRNSGLLLVLKKSDQWDIDRYGPVYIDTASVVAIREIKPRSAEKYEDEGEADCCEKESPKKYAKVKDIGVPDESEKKDKLVDYGDKFMVPNEESNK